MAADHHGIDLLPVITFLAAAVVAAPSFKRLGLGSMQGYLASGIAIGPFGLGVLFDPASILDVAELGVVLFLFVIVRSMACMITARRRASATRAFLRPRRLAIFMAQLLSAKLPRLRVRIELAAS